MSFTVVVNGEKRELTDGATVRQLVEQLKFSVEKVAIERNRRLVRADRLDDRLADNDEIEIVTFVGGGS